MLSEYKTAPGSGNTPGSAHDVTTETLNLRMDHALDMAPQWILTLRTDLPLLAKNPITSTNPDGDYLDADQLCRVFLSPCPETTMAGQRPRRRSR
jgi:hypothetical protein